MLIPFLHYVNSCKICYRIGSHITVKASWVGVKPEILMPVHFAYGTGFTVVLLFYYKQN